MKLTDLFADGVVAPLGYSPTSASIKPVHIANGLCRATLGAAYDPTLLNRLVNRWAPGRAEERHASADLAAEHAGPLGDFARSENTEHLNTFRELLRDVIGADDAVFDKNENCSYTLTCGAHVTGDHSDRRTGRFLFHILATDLGEGQSPALDLLRALLADDSDELAVLSLPLITGEQPEPFDPGEPPEALVTRDAGDGKRVFRRPIVRSIRAGFDALAAFERARGSKLRSLRRLVTFATFALFLHLTNRSLDYEDGRMSRGSRPPLLLDFTQQGWTPIAIASHATYNLAGKSIERMIQRGVAEQLSAVAGRSWTKRRAEAFIHEVELRGAERAVERRRGHYLDAFRSYLGAHEIEEALTLATVDALLDELTGTPLDFARGLGVRGGLLAPRGQRAVRKRYAPSPEVLEVMLASVVAPGDEVELEDLAERWFERYGVIVGARPSDAADLARWSIQGATKEDLLANARALRDALGEIGYARRYADGVTVIRAATAEA